LAALAIPLATPEKRLLAADREAHEIHAQGRSG
jgi:hypothetical protein